MEQTQSQTPPVQNTPQPMPASAPKKGGSNTALKVILITLGSCLVLGVIVFVGAGFLAKKAIETGGGKLAEKIIEQGLGKDVDANIDKDNFEIKGKDGSFSTSKKLPDNFPSDVPVYPGSQVESSLKATGNDQVSESVTVSLSTSDSYEKVVNFYKSQLPTNGWNVTATYEAGDSFTTTGEKGNRSLYVTVGGQEGKITIVLSITTQKD